MPKAIEAVEDTQVETQPTLETKPETQSMLERLSTLEKQPKMHPKLQTRPPGKNVKVATR